MSLEELDNLETPPVNTVNTVDDFEAALAATATDVPAVDVIDVAVVPDDVQAVAENDMALVPDQVESEEEENDENAEFRRALRTAPGDWYVVHSYAGFEKKVKGNLANRIISLNMEDYIFQIEVPEEEVMEIKNGQRK